MLVHYHENRDIRGGFSHFNLIFNRMSWFHNISHRCSTLTIDERDCPIIKDAILVLLVSTL